MQPYNTTTLRVSDTAQEIPSLIDDMQELAHELIRENDMLTPWHDQAYDLAKSISYSLSYSQGDGVCFTSGEIDGYHIARTGYSHYYSHENTFRVEHDEDKGGTPSQAEVYTNELRDICKVLEKHGYSLISSSDEDSIKFQAFERFKKMNGIESEDCHYEFVEDKENGTLIATSWDTSLDDFYLILPETTTLTREVQFKVFK